MSYELAGRRRDRLHPASNAREKPAERGLKGEDGENPAIYPAVEIEIWESETRGIRLRSGIQGWLSREKVHRERQCVSENVRPHPHQV